VVDRFEDALPDHWRPESCRIRCNAAHIR